MCVREKKMIGLDCKIINGLYSYVVVRSMGGYEKKLASEIFQIAHCENVSNIKYVRMASKLAKGKGKVPPGCLSAEPVT